jgi:ATP-dependent protease ClpP protease subunit
MTNLYHENYIMDTNVIDFSKSFGASDGRFTKPLSNLFEFYLIGEIKSAENYIEWFNIIRHATENDGIKIYINSPGGDLFTAIQFMRVLNETPAHKTISVEGMCVSAATLIFMTADAYEISPHSIFMFHNYSGQVFGKGGEMVDQLTHERKWSKKLLTDTYNGFMTKKEIKSMLSNKDIWLNDKEVAERIKARIKHEEKNDKNNL